MLYKVAKSILEMHLYIKIVNLLINGLIQITIVDSSGKK